MKGVFLAIHSVSRLIYGTKEAVDEKLAVSTTYFSNFWRTSPIKPYFEEIFLLSIQFYESVIVGTLLAEYDRNVPCMADYTASDGAKLVNNSTQTDALYSSCLVMLQ